MKISWEKLDKINKKYLKKLRKNIKKFGSNPNYILGNNVEELERKIAEKVGVKYAIATGNGLDALTISLLSFNFAKDSEVIVPSNTFYATVLSIVRCGLKPVLCEPNIKNYNIEVSSIEKLITLKTVAIMPVHLYGNPCNMDEIMKIANKYKLKVIEDCAQSFGAKYKGKMTGSFGDAAAFSFYPTKNLGGIGDGGMITTNNKKIYDMAKKIRSYGGNNYKYDVKGINSRMDEIQAMFLLEKLKDIDILNKLKINNANLYRNKINNPEIIIPEDNNKQYIENVYHQFCVRCKNRDEIRDYLKKNGVDTLIHYPIPIHKQKGISNYISLDYNIASEICETILSLPCSSLHSKKEIMYVVDLINNFKSIK